MQKMSIQGGSAETPWHSYSKETVISGLATHGERGLLPSEAHERLRRYGPNAFEKESGPGLIGKILRQFKSPLMLILLVAGILTMVLGRVVDAVVISAALLINIIIGTFQEERASQAFEKLASSQERFATVIRGGVKKVIPQQDLVVGDVVVLGSGTQVPADVRLLHAKNLTVDESALTGEWLAVEKDTKEVSKKAHITDRHCMAWMGTLVASGEGRGVVVATGGGTALGRIAEGLQAQHDSRTPLQKNIHSVAMFLTWMVLAIVAGIFVLGVLRGQPITEMLLLAVAVAVSIVPEGLPAAVTAILAIGMEQILKRGGLVRNLLAVETLGSTTVILTDKTGTLTEAKMRLRDVLSAEQHESDRDRALAIAMRTSDAFIEEVSDGETVVRGRPMERAIVQGGLDEGMTPRRVSARYEQLDFLAFDTARRYAAGLYRDTETGDTLLFVSGAPEVILEAATNVYVQGDAQKLSDEQRADLEKTLETHTNEGMRLTATGYKKVSWSEIPSEEGASLIQDLAFAGFLLFHDPIRDDAEESVIKAKESGAHVIMLTGDNSNTARTIAREVGITHNQEVLEGSEIDEMSNKELLDALTRVRVFARVLPEQKMRIARLLQSKGEIVAMTGDGVNDAPALRRANIGIAVGAGTEVAKEASDLILLSNSFSIIVAAIEEGRRIIDNLKKAITHLISTSFGEVFLIVGALLFALPLPILPVQILWLNIIEEGLLSFAFAFEPAEKDVMKRNPRSSRIRLVLTPEIRTFIIAMGTITGVFVLGLFFWLSHIGMSVEEIRTVMFLSLSFDAILFVLSLKDFHRPIWRINIFSNRFLLGALSISVAILLATIFVPQLRSFLSLVTLSATHVPYLIAVLFFDLTTTELAKYLLFWRKK